MLLPLLCLSLPFSLLFVCIIILLTLSSTVVIVNSMCPGACKSDLGRQWTESSWLMKIVAAIFTIIFAQPTEVGSRTLVLAATMGPEKQGSYVRYYGTEDEYRK